MIGKTRRNSDAREPRQGAATVEFAIVFPIFLMMLAGIIEFGQAFRIQHALSNAARRGTRAAIMTGTTTAQVRQKVQSQCVQILGVAQNDVKVNVSVNGASGAEVAGAGKSDEVAVTVSLPFSKAGAGFYSNFFKSATLSSTCILEHE